MTLRNIASLLTWAAMACAAQTTVPQPSFEVASVKVSAPSARPIFRMTGGPGTSSPGELIASNVALSLLLTRAYNLMPWQLIGPGWLSSGKYDIDAKIP